jgi:agmatinase
VGIRSFSPEEAQLIRKRGYTPFYAHEIEPFDDSWIDLVVEALPEMVYITLDLDGLDPSVIPGTGTPEPGGLSYRQVINLIKRVGSDRKVVAADINELVKIDGCQVSEYTAAKLASKIMVYCVKH